MLLDCPHCGRSMKRRLIRSVPAPGERRFLPMRAIPACPHCRGLLAGNLHWSEWASAVLVVVLLAGSEFGRVATPQGRWLWLGGLVLSGLALGYFDCRYWSKLQRFRRYEPKA